MTKFIETTDAAGGATTTYTLEVGDFVQGTITSAATDTDWYAVNLVAGQTYTFAATGVGINNLQDVWLELFNSAGTSLQVGTALPGDNKLITFTAATTGIHYIDVEDLDFVSSGSTYELSVATGTKANFDVAMTAGVIDSDVSWSSTPGTGKVVTYSFRSSLPSGYSVDGSNVSTFSQASAAQIAAIESILSLYSEMTGITFQRVAPGGYSNSAQMVFGNYNDPSDGAGAFAFYPGGGTGNLDYGGDVWMNTSVSTTSLPVGSYSWFAVMHEIGHALGLSHPGMYNAAPGVSITYANNAQFTQDSGQYTIMSYFDESSTGAYAGGYQDTPMIGDILALQNIYGANMSTRTGNNTYGFNNNTGNSIYAFAVGATPAFAIWDAGGIDTIDASGYANAQIIRLTAGEFSNIGGLTSNVSIAANAVIENAIGGSGVDTIFGNSAANTLQGNSSNDLLSGGLGNDTLFGNFGDDYLYGNLGVDTLYGGRNNDYLHGGQGDDYLYGNIGDDDIWGGVGSDTIDGGDGFDTALFSGLSSAFSYTNLGGGNWTVVQISTGEIDTLVAIERLGFDNGFIV